MRAQHDKDQIIEWLKEDDVRMNALRTASSINLPGWCLAAGFVRNLVWDKIHGYLVPTKLSDIDLIYYCREDISVAIDKKYESDLKSMSSLPWSVKNQARMHIRNGDKPYTSTIDAMSYWVEVETAVGVRMSENNEIDMVAPFGVDALFENSVTINMKRPKKDVLMRRLEQKKWLEIWPDLVVRY